MACDVPKAAEPFGVGDITDASSLNNRGAEVADVPEPLTLSCKPATEKKVMRNRFRNRRTGT